MPITHFADPAALNPMITPPLPEQIELHRDRLWRRDEDLRVESAIDGERSIEDVGIKNRGQKSEHRDQSKVEVNQRQKGSDYPRHRDGNCGRMGA
jgi:hypothetical protein